MLEPSKFDEAMLDPDWLSAMLEELNQFERNKVWSLVKRPDPTKHNIIGTKWIFRNKQDEDGIVVRNKARLVAQGYTQIEGIDFGETYAPVARLESIRVMLAFANFNGILLYQMDVKSAFVNGEIEEEVYVMQPPGFEDSKMSGPGVSVCKSSYDIVIWRAENRTHLSKQTRTSTERSRKASYVRGIPSRPDDQLRWVLIVRTQVK